MNESHKIDFSDSKRFTAEYEKHFSALKYFALQYIEDEGVVCDLLQELFIKLWERKEVFENEYAFRTYLYHSVRNNCISYIRTKNRNEARLETWQPEVLEEAFVNQMIKAEIYALVNEVFEELPESSKQVYLKSLEGKSHKEIAEELNVTIHTIKKHKNNANRYLRERLKDLLCFMAWLQAFS